MASIPRSAVRIGLQALLALAWSARPAPGGAVTTAPTSSDLKASTLDPAENVPGSADSFVFTGAATHEIPIAVPQGRLGMAPNIDLIYNSQNRKEEGALGMGWSLPLEAIERKLEGGVKYDACEQGCEVAYVKGGAAIALVRTASGEYRSKIDDGANVRFRYDATTASWTAYDKNGRKYQYGQTAASRQDDPGNAARIFRWCLDRVEDSNGNYLTISYAKDSGQIYPGEIQYTGNSSPGLEPPLAPKTTVRFALAARLNSDPVDKYWVRSDVRGFNVITAFYVAEINVLVDGVLSWKYALEYAYSPLTQRLLLKKVRRFGEGGVKELVPSVDLEWTPGPGFGWGSYQDDSYRLETWAGLPTNGLPAGSVIATGDFNGDGRSDLADTTPGAWSWTVRLGSDSKRFDTATWQG